MRGSGGRDDVTADVWVFSSPPHDPLGHPMFTPGASYSAAQKMRVRSQMSHRAGPWSALRRAHIGTWSLMSSAPGRSPQTSSPHSARIATAWSSRSRHPARRLGAKARAAAFARLRPQPGGPPMLAVATGPYAAEGFDCPALDTVFLAAPIAQKGTARPPTPTLNYRICYSHGGGRVGYLPDRRGRHLATGTPGQRPQDRRPGR